MSKLSDKYDPNEHIIGPNIYFRIYKEVIDKALRETSDFDVQKESIKNYSWDYKLNQEETEFFQQIYSPACSLLSIFEKQHLKEIFNIDYEKNISLGAYEYQVISFLLSPVKNILFLIADIGFGKSTLIKYVIWYLLKETQRLKDKIIPIYLSVDHYRNSFQYSFSSLQSDEEMNIAFELTKLIVPRLKKACSPFVNLEDDKLWEYLQNIPLNELQNYNITILGYDPNNQDYKNKLKDLRVEVLKKEDTIWYYIAKYINTKISKVFTIIFDNIDPLPYNIIKVITREALRYQEEYNIKIVIPIRKINYEKLNQDPDEIIMLIGTTIARIELIERDVKSFIQKRFEYLKFKIGESNNEILLGDMTLDVKSTKRLFPLFVKLLLSDHCTKTLTAFSNNDLRTILLFFKIYLAAGPITPNYINDQEITKELLKLVANENYTIKDIPLYILLNSIITCNKKTYFSANHNINGMAANTIINLYCNGNHPFNNNLIRTHVLQYFQNNDNKSFSSLEADYKKIFLNDGDNEIEQSLKHAVRRLITCHLLISPDTYKVAETNSVTPLLSISINKKVSNHYIDTIAHYFEYLALMKDDVIYYKYHEIQDCIVQGSLQEKYNNIILFISYLIDREIEMFQGPSFRDAKILKHFYHNFCKNQYVCISYFISNQLYEYAKTKRLSQSSLDRHMSLNDKIKNINEDFLSIIQSA